MNGVSILETMSVSINQSISEYHYLLSKRQGPYDRNEFSLLECTLNFPRHIILSCEPIIWHCISVTELSQFIFKSVDKMNLINLNCREMSHLPNPIPWCT